MVSGQVHLWVFQKMSISHALQTIQRAAIRGHHIFCQFQSEAIIRSELFPSFVPPGNIRSRLSIHADIFLAHICCLNVVKPCSEGGGGQTSLLMGVKTQRAFII